MNELMRCYSDVYVMNREEYALRFPYLLIKEKYIVTKHPLDFKNFSKIIATYTDPFFIFLLRDPRDVIISKHYKNQDTYLSTYPTWEEAIQAYEHLEYDKKLLVRYENLITQPALVQTQISTKLDLDAIRNFEQFYRNVSKGHQDIKSLGEARPLDSNNAGKFKRPEHFERIKQQLQQFPTMHEYLVKYGYENDDTWKSHFLGNH